MAFTNEASFYNYFHYDKNYYGEAINIFQRFPGTKTILEIGSGTGNLTNCLDLFNCKITCLEPSKKMSAFYHGKNKVINQTIQEFNTKKKFDLVLATYDVLNYVPFKDFHQVMEKIKKLGKHHLIEMWSERKVKFLTVKKSEGFIRIRIGFKFRNIAYLWYIYLGGWPVISYHKLYLHFVGIVLKSCQFKHLDGL